MDIRALTLNGPNVSQWDDKSPKGFDFAEGTALRSAGLLGLSGLTTAPPKPVSIPARERKDKRAKKSRRKMQRASRRGFRRKR